MSKISFGEIKELVLPQESRPKMSRPWKPYSFDRRSKFSLYVLQSELERIEAHLLQSPEIESGGLLIGHPFVDINNVANIFTVIVGSVPVRSSNSGVGHYTVSPEELPVARTKIPEGLLTVGWYHSHPGHGVFLSGADLSIMESIYNLEWQTAYVFDTRSGEKGFFHGARGEKVTNLFVLDEKPAIIEAIARYNCAVSATEGGDKYVLESFRSWLQRNSVDELSHWVQLGRYQDIPLETNPSVIASDGEWQKEFEKAVIYFQSGKLQSAQFVFEHLAQIKSSPEVSEYLRKIDRERHSRK
jgi:proteasome lid subunit RPN8/RPN11